MYHFKHFLDRVCNTSASGKKAKKNNYIINIFNNYKFVLNELDKMENCDEYQYKNSLNIFSLTLGPFEKANKEQNDQAALL